MTEIKRTKPPNFAAIAEVFPGAHGRYVIFAYAPHIYAPNLPETSRLSDELIAHENVHIERQMAHDGGALGWWQEYLVNPEFRYNEELLAHRAEYQSVMAQGLPRQQRRAALKVIGQKLAAPLYGRMISVKKAMEDIAA